ncbi:MAG: alpha/beta fold hydrolase [Pirellulales bacterium]
MNSKFSTMAVIMQVVLLLTAILAGRWIWLLLPESKIVALLIPIGHMLVPAVFLLGGIAIMLIANRKSLPSLSESLMTWLTDLIATWRVGLWLLPFRWNQIKNSQIPEEKSPVIFVHGFFCNRGMWNPWLQQLQRQKVPVIAVNLQPIFGSLDRYVGTLEAAVKQAESLSSSKPVFVCHSMGGLAVRRWLVSNPSARSRIARIVTIATPHHGTWLGKLAAFVNGRQMGIQSRWLNELKKSEESLRPENTYEGFVCWHSNSDNVVMPAWSATLPGADNRQIRGIGHLAIAYHPELMKAEIDEMTSTGERASTSEKVCTSDIASTRQ